MSMVNNRKIKRTGNKLVNRKREKRWRKSEREREGVGLLITKTNMYEYVNNIIFVSVPVPK